MNRTYIIDTNVFLYFPECILNFKEGDLVIPEVVLEELDNFKRNSGELGYKARRAIRIIDEIRTKGNLVKGIKLSSGTHLRVETGYCEVEIPRAWDKYKPDNRIIQICKGLMEKVQEVHLVTMDAMEKIKADSLGISVYDFPENFSNDYSTNYTGRTELYASEENIDKFYIRKHMNLEELSYYCQEKQSYIKPELIVNEFVLIRATNNPRKTALGRYNGKEVVPLIYSDMRPLNIVPRNIGQKFMQEALFMECDKAPLVIIKGPAGTAKTLFSLAIGLYKVLETDPKEYRRILVCRANVTMDEEIGFLPGSEQDKILPFMRPVYDNLEVLMNSYYKCKYKDEEELNCKIREFFDRRIVTTEAVAYLRGRSIYKNWVIIDEAQNLSPKQIKAIVTRIGNGTKLILIGDPEQIDQPSLDFKHNGLCYASEKMRGSPLCYQLTLNYEECERSPLAYEGSKRL